MAEENFHEVKEFMRASLLLKPGDSFNGGIVDRIEGKTIHYTVELPAWSESIVTSVLEKYGAQCPFCHEPASGCEMW